MLYEYRSNRREGLAYMDRFFDGVISSFQNFGIGVSVELLGDRPCKGDVDPKGADRNRQTRLCPVRL